MYIFKTGFPAFFLPLAPEVVHDELQRHGLIAGSSGMLIVVALQFLLTLGIVLWLVRTVHRHKQNTAFLKMSCVSKKVFHQGKWMSVEKYLADHHNIVVSHGMTPEESDAWLREAREWADSQYPERAAGKLEVALK